MNTRRARKIHRQATATAQTYIVRPKSADEIVRIVRDRTRYPTPIRALGSGSATTRCVSLGNTGTSLDLSELDRVVRVNEGSVTAQAGITLSELADVLGDKGLELIGGFDLADRTLGGAVSSVGLETSTSRTEGSFVSQILEVKLVTADGRKLRVSNEHGTLLNLMRLSYGLLGIVYEVTLRVRPIQPFSVQSQRLSFAELEGFSPRFAAADAGMKMRLFPFRDRVLCEIRVSSPDDSSGVDIAWRLKSWAANSIAPNAAAALAKVVPVNQLRYPLVDGLMEATQTLSSTQILRAGSMSVEQKSHAGRKRKQKFRHSTWAFPESAFGRVANEFLVFSQDHYQRTAYRCDMPALSSRIARDRSALFAPSYEESIVTISPMSTQLKGWEEYAFEYADFAMRHEGIPIFSHSAHLPADYSIRHFKERLTLFKKMRYQFDPENRLLNPFFANFLLH